MNSREYIELMEERKHIRESIDKAYTAYLKRRDEIIVIIRALDRENAEALNACIGVQQPRLEEIEKRLRGEGML